LEGVAAHIVYGLWPFGKEGIMDAGVTRLVSPQIN